MPLGRAARLLAAGQAQSLVGDTATGSSAAFALSGSGMVVGLGWADWQDAALAVPDAC